MPYKVHRNTVETTLEIEQSTTDYTKQYSNLLVDV